MKLIRYIYQHIIKPYLGTFDGLSKEVWWLAFITLINRAGTMVIPFLSLYLTKHMGFSLGKVGWVMSAFGIGSVIGSWIGGRLTDKIGYYKVMFFSLVGAGFMFVYLQYLETFQSLCLGVMGVMILADMFRPAMFVALNAYSKPQNKTRSVTLIRLAINLGFSAGPAVGGFIITKMGYSGLFWVDGITCVLASILLLLVLHPKSARILDEVFVENPKSVWKDTPFFIFFAAMVIFGFVFLQYFSTIPLFYRDIIKLTESEIGLLMAMNGFLIFLLEMPLIKTLESGRHHKIRFIIIGAVLMGTSLLLLNLGHWVLIVVLGMLLMTIGEMILFPFSNSFVIDRAKGGKQGQYMALYSISFSIAHIFGHNSGMHLIEKMGYSNTWFIMFELSLVAVLLLVWLKRKVLSEELHVLNDHCIKEGNRYRR
ncbi:MFS transporter [Flavobacteriaceae bacterium F08102]|nr:MFS transporter [Flavobacteriaceae bacterium F08102]